MFPKTLSKTVCLWALAPALAATLAQLGSTAPDFALKDQYDHEVQLSTQRGKAVLLICGDRIGSDYMGVWARAVRDSAVAPSVTVFRIANLRAVPSLLHSYVKHKFQSLNAEGKPSSPVLLDWDALVAKLYGFTDDVTNVYLIDQKGILRYTACGKGTPEETAKLLAAIGNLGQAE